MSDEPKSEDIEEMTELGDEDGTELAEIETADVNDAGDDESDMGFALLAVALLVLVGGCVYFVGAILRSNSETEAAQASAEAALESFDPIADGVVVTLPPETLPLVDDAEPLVDPDDEAAVEQAPTTTTTLVASPSVNPADIAFTFVNRAPGDEYGRVGYIDPQGERHVTELECDRVDRNNARGICLSATAGLAGTGVGLVLDPNLNPTKRFGVSQPSRAAASPDGEVVAYTSFTLGHSYLVAGEFATLTQLISVERNLAADLETDFSTFDIDGAPISSIDRNYWGVTFVDSDRFYATVGSAGETSIVEGRVSTSRLDVVFDNASCPEVSPDGSMIVAKEQRGEVFQLVLIDVATGDRRDLGETRSVDDQVEWVDDSTILYGLPNLEEGTDAQPVFDVWSLDVAAGSTPQLLIPFAESPAA